MSAPPTRPLRRDAEQNRRRVLDAAAEVFAADGLDAGVEQVARAAGVGMGTLYRRFPTKDALIAALVQDVLDTMLRLAEQAAALPDGTGLERFLETSSAYQAEHRGCLPRLWTLPAGHEGVPAVRRRIALLLADAQRHGRVRAEVTATDLTVLMWSVRGVIESGGALAPDAWRRHLSLLVAGLRPSAVPLAHRPLTQAEVDGVLASS